MSNNYPFDLPKAVSICAQAFFNDDLDKYFFPNESDRRPKQERLYRYFLKRNMKNVYTTSTELEGLMIVERPDSHNDEFTISDLFLGLPLFKLGVGTIKKMINFQINAVKIRKQLIRDPYWYVVLIAIAPEFQGRGFASRLLKPILLQAEQEKEYVFLETHNPKNIPIYEKLGFKIMDSTIIEHTHLYHYCLIR